MPTREKAAEKQETIKIKTGRALPNIIRGSIIDAGCGRELVNIISTISVFTSRYNPQTNKIELVCRRRDNGDFVDAVSGNGAYAVLGQEHPEFQIKYDLLASRGLIENEA